MIDRSDGAPHRPVRTHSGSRLPFVTVSGHRRSVFEVFARSLPDGRRYGVVAGTARVIDAIAELPLRP